MPSLVCPNCCSTTEVKLKPHLIISGSITFVLGLVDLGMSGIVFSYLTNYFYGAWWSALVVMITGLLGVLSVRRGVVVAACVMSVVAIMMAFAGVVVDGVGNTQMDSIQTCASTSSYYAVDNYMYYGNAAYNNDAMTCVQHYYTADTDCYCVDSESNCFFLNGQSDCGLIITSYITNLKVAVAMDVLCLVSVLAFSIVTCFSICCPYGFRKKKNTNFRNDLGDDGRGSTTTNPLQNDKRPILERVATFGKVGFGTWNSSNSDVSRESTTNGVVMMDMSAVSAAASTKSPAKKAGDVSSFSNPLKGGGGGSTVTKKGDGGEAALAETPSSSTDTSFSPSVSDFQFASGPSTPPPPPRPAPPSGPPAAAGGTTPPRSAALAAGNAGMSSNPLARKKPTPKVSASTTGTVNTSTSEDTTTTSGSEEAEITVDSFEATV